jgi:anti-anti-sigma factor
VRFPETELRTHEGEDETTLAMSGELTIADAVGFHQRLLRALARSADLRLDLAEVLYMDASILQLICAAHRSAATHGVQVILENVQLPLTQDARMLGLEPVLSSDAKALRVEGG